MPIRSKLVIALVAIVAVMVLPLAITLRSIEELHDETARLRDTEFAASLLLGRMRTGVDNLRQYEIAMLYIHTPRERARLDSAVTRLAAMSDSLERFELESEANRIRGAVSNVAAAVPHEYRAAADSQVASAEGISNRIVRPAITQAEFWVTAAERSLRERSRERVARVASGSEEAQRVAGAALAGGVLLALLIAIWITGTITRPIRHLESGMRAVAEGDFAHRLPVSPERRDEFGRLAGSYRVMADQLKELDKLKAEFVSIASHELKTPINVLLGYLQLLNEGVYGPLSGQQREVLETLEAQCQSLNRLVRQLLDVSRFQAGGGKLDPRPIALPRFLEDLERAFDVLARQRDIGFRVLRGADLPAEVVWDQDRMNEVLGNLLSNAFKFTSRGGRVELAVEAEGEMIHMSVRDTGAGIPREHLPHIFRKFFQADNQAAADSKGTGLGLAIAKEIVEAHGGTIDVDSAPGAGTTFTISLPARASSRRPGPLRAISAVAS